MLSKKEFKNYMFQLKNIQNSVNDVNNSINKLSDYNFNYISIDKIEDLVLSLLEHTMNDSNNKNISYFIYELDWGKKGKDCITDKDKNISLRNMDELYDYLINIDG